MFINFSVFGREVFSINAYRTDFTELLAELAPEPAEDEAETPFGFAPAIEV